MRRAPIASARAGSSRSPKSLNVPPAYFFEGAPSFDEAKADPILHSAAAEAGSAYVVEFISTMEGLHLNRSFARIKDAKVRKRIVDLVTAIAGGRGERGAAGSLRRLDTPVPSRDRLRKMLRADRFEFAGFALKRPNDAAAGQGPALIGWEVV